jgi:CheY-like chemotaxis protein
MTPDRKRAPGSSIKTILIVEDDDDIREICTQLLKEATLHQVRSVADGITALTLLQEVVPHMFLLDYSLPQMNGLTLVEKIRAQKIYEQTPILLMSANLPERPLSYPKIYRLDKPFELDELLELIQKLLV